MEAVEIIAEEVAANLEEVASATRSINANGVGYFLGGLVIGVTAGIYIGRKLNKAKIRAEIYEEAEEEISQLRAHWRAKATVAEPKPDPIELVEELGYVPRHELGLSMPSPTTDRPLPAPVPITEMSVADNGEVKIHKNKDEGWNYGRELEARSPDVPYIIHQDEYEKSPDFDYSKITFTYYIDDVLVDDEDNQPVDDGARLVGEDNLKWGHGSDDPDVVYVRNDRRELDIQITRVPQSYEEKVLGLENDSEN